MNTEPSYPSYPPVLPPNVQQTVITDIQIPFGRLVVLIIKYLFAAIPALIIFWIFMLIVGLILSAIFGGFFEVFRHALENAAQHQQATH
jgi:hypothetical protein